MTDHFGYEVQIDELGQPDGSNKFRTGAIYGVDSQAFSFQPARPAGEWNDYEIEVKGNRFTVRLNGVQVTDFIHTDLNRGQPTTSETPSYIGLQIHFDSSMAFRNIEFKSL